MRKRTLGTVVGALLTLGALVGLCSTSFAALTPYDVPVVTCEDATQTTITIHVCTPLGTTGAPAGITIQWMDKAVYDQTGWLDSEDPLMCALSLSGQPGMNGPGSRWELMPGECEDVTLGRFLDETGASVNHEDCKGDLECGHTYVIRWFAHAGRGFGRSAFSANLECSTAPCPTKRCTYTFGYWRNHGGPVGCDQARVNPPDVPWCASILSGGLTLGSNHYTAAQLCQILNVAGKGRGSLVLAHQLIAYYLNTCGVVENCTALGTAVADANSFIGSTDLIALLTADCGGKIKPPGCDPPPGANTTLTLFNEGRLCERHCGTDPCPGGPSCGDKPLETPLDSHSGSPTPTRKGTWGSIKTIYR
jgi:hypothetical protein